MKTIKHNNYTYNYEKGVITIYKNDKFIKKIVSDKYKDIGGIFSKKENFKTIVYALVLMTDEQYYFILDGSDFKLWKKLSNH